MDKFETMRLDDISTEDSRIDMNDMYEAIANAGPENLRKKRILELNADGQPMSYNPLSTVPWPIYFKWVSKSRNRDTPIVMELEFYKDTYVRSGIDVFPLPSVVMHTEMIPPRGAAMTPRNILLRDNFTCQYTGIQYPASELNLDHVIPKSRGGGFNWENIVTCNIEVNSRKGNRTPDEAGLKLIRRPYAPSPWEMREKGRNRPVPLDHESWSNYVYWHRKLEED